MTNNKNNFKLTASLLLIAMQDLQEVLAKIAHLSYNPIKLEPIYEYSAGAYVPSSAEFATMKEARQLEVLEYTKNSLEYSLGEFGDLWIGTDRVAGISFTYNCGEGSTYFTDEDSLADHIKERIAYDEDFAEGLLYDLVRGYNWYYEKEHVELAYDWNGELVRVEDTNLDNIESLYDQALELMQQIEKDFEALPEPEQEE